MGVCISKSQTKSNSFAVNKNEKDAERKEEEKNILTKSSKQVTSVSDDTKLHTPPKHVKPADESQRACFGAGCYWGTEKYFRYNFQKKFPKLGQIVEGAVGFMGPPNAKENPSYREVCSGETGHVEVYDFEFKGGPAYYEELVKFFFQFHDPTTHNRQGNDRGTQYASVIYCYNDEQFEIATKVKNQLQELLNKRKIKAYQTSIVRTDIRRSTKFYPAHDEHQDYLTANPNGYCNHRIRFDPWPEMD